MLCGLFGKTRLAFYDCLNREQIQLEENRLIIAMVFLIREDMPKLGTSKLHFLLNPSFKRSGIKMGRDCLHELLFKNGLTVKKRRFTPRTTDSNHFMKKYPNKLKDLVITAPNQLWVSDITYIRLRNDFSYLSLITDAYSHKIVGYSLYATLSRHGTLEALRMALKDKSNEDLLNLVHHSDRGSQYCSFDYTSLLISNNVTISMTQDGDPRENAVAERVNGILKSEMGLNQDYIDHDFAKIDVDKQIRTYNELRPHSSCNYLTPCQAELEQGELKKRWKAKETNWMNFKNKKDFFSLANIRV